ncbi:Ldh family oxidoreductase [Pelagibius sp. Alg239-R121]|uniref:Ldh family oxidoreductase n=1 Tax=Pelagibius sp. Alg239-R121 TaxID=2993448 RepID=UPI0024A687C0|nr:Ldh family oxidoreductase [Pelagibius sp. Alg239-R121]
MSGDSKVYRAENIEAFLTSAFIALNVPEADAKSVAGLMVRADLYGYDTHGTFRLRQYVNRLRDGGTNPNANITTPVERGASAVVDGDNGLGHLAMQRATELAIEKATGGGIGWVGVRNGNHAGPASLYVNMAVERDMIGIVAAVGSANHVAPFGGQDLLLGTNPIAIAVPAGEAPPFVLDMATSNAAAGKIKVLAQRGEPMPEGWMIDREGNPMTDPNRQGEGLLLPIGGAKGYGLAMAIGLLAGTLNGAAFGDDVVNFTKDTTSPTNTGQFVAAISVEAFGDVAVFKSAVDGVLATMRGSTPLAGHDPVRIPGQLRGDIHKDRNLNGIPLHPNLVDTLSKIAQELSIPELAG